MANPTENETGYSIDLPGALGDTATLGTLSDFFQRTDTTFAMVFSVCFLDENYNVFFGGSQGSSTMKIMKNKTTGTVDFEVIDESGDKRSFTWTSPLLRGVWYNFIINGTANGADGIALYVNGTLKTVTAQTNDVGFDPTVSMSLKFGDVDATNLGAMKITKPYFYNRSLTAGEITLLTTIKKYPTDFIYAWDLKRPSIGA